MVMKEVPGQTALPMETPCTEGLSETWVSLEDMFAFSYLHSPLLLRTISNPGRCYTRGRPYPNKAKLFFHPTCQPWGITIGNIGPVGDKGSSFPSEEFLLMGLSGPVSLY